MLEAHDTKYSFHPRGTKIYRDLRQIFWWSNMKRDKMEFVDKCLTWKKVKYEQQWLIGELKPLTFPCGNGTPSRWIS